MTRRQRGNEKAQSLVEFALAVPLLLLFILGIVYFGQLFYTQQIITMAAQEGARSISRIPNLSDATVRQMARGFTVDGAATNPASVIYAQFAAGNMLSNGKTGDLPSGTTVQILPWDNTGDVIPPGTVAVKITYPFTFVSGGSFGNQTNANGTVSAVNIWTSFNGSPVALANLNLTEKAVAAEEVYQQEGN